MMITVQCGQLTLFRGSAVAEVDGFLFGQLPRRVFCFDAGPQLVQLSLLANLDVQLLLLGLHISSMHPHTHTHTNLPAGCETRGWRSSPRTARPDWRPHHWPAGVRARASAKLSRQILKTQSIVHRVRCAKMGGICLELFRDASELHLEVEDFFFAERGTLFAEDLYFLGRCEHQHERQTYT